MGDILPDILEPNLRVVFCGMAAGTASAAKGAYYAGPGNKFWPTLFNLGIIPVQLSSQEFRQVTRYGIGLTDISKRESGPDSKLSKSGFDPDGLRKKMEKFRPMILAFNGKYAASVFLNRKSIQVKYGIQNCPSEPCKIFVLPSTSGNANGHWNIEHWRDLATHLKSL